MKIKEWLFHFFHFNKQERNGVFVLCVIIIVLFLVRLFIPFFVGDSTHVELITLNVSTDKLSLDEIPSPSYADEKINKSSNGFKKSSERFVFNPNTVTEEDAQKLGFSKKLSAVLVKYRNKGGKFYKPEDLKKLYGLSPKLYNELDAYILIPHTKKELKKDSSVTTTFVASRTIYEKKKYEKQLIEINTADSLAIVYLRGVGPGFTKRIMKYRSMLGGFHSVNQLKEVYGMTDSLFLSLSSQIQLDKNAITKMPINAIDFNSLRKHPYFNFQTAQAIINYRTKHGKLTETDFINLGIFSEEKLKLILPYILY